METHTSNSGVELPERRAHHEPIIRVWDRLVRLNHWLLVLTFAIIYLYYRKFPTHAYAGYLVIILVIWRILWGFVGSRAARFSSFAFSPKAVLEYARDAMQGHASYHVSHNPMGSWMVFILLGMLLLNSIVGLILYSSGQQLGPFGASVPYAWEDCLIQVHKILGHLTAACVVGHLFGVLWAARLHRENYVVAMLTGHKRVSRHAVAADIEGYEKSPDNIVPQRLRGLEAWLNQYHPLYGSLILLLLLLAVAYGVASWLITLNKYLPAY